VHNLGLGYAREIGTALREEPYEVLERLARLLGERPQVLGVPGDHVCVRTMCGSRTGGWSLPGVMSD
jgi:hypothetical protein